jgi:hypothetical protein
MTHRAITSAQRFGVWRAWKGSCFWCREPVLFRDIHIDHVIPLDAVNEVGAPDTIRRLYGLSADFDFDCFENWVPTHAGCNQRKSFTLPDPVAAFAIYLKQVSEHVSLAKATASKVESDGKKAPLLTKIASAIVAGDITRENIEQLFADLPTFVKKGLKRMAFRERLLIAPGWEVHVVGHRVSVKRVNV